uniref:Uncharacterized protein n=1 Tax=Ditylenchus dipsaci TaxID=166011 RepID=A0A915EVP9_9BILA
MSFKHDSQVLLYLFQTIYSTAVAVNQYQLPIGEMCPAGNQWTFQPHEIEHILKDDYIQFMMQRERHGIPSSAPAT